MGANKAILLVGVTALAAVLAGCGAKTTDDVSAAASSLPPIAEGKGAITGLLIDDRYRPIPDATVLLTPAGLQATTDDEGQFRFTDLEPTAYVLLATAPDHEAAPKNVDVTAGQYTEVEVQARRIFSDAGTTITTEYSVFSPCMQSAVYVAADDDYCMPDQSGDTYRPGITVDLRRQGTNITFLVSEILINQPDTYVFVVRCADGSSFGCGEYGYVNITGEAYGRVIMKNGADYMHTPQSINWTNKKPMDGLLFFYGTGGDVVTTGARPVGCLLPPETNPLNGKPAFCRDYYGAGAKFGVKAKIVMTAFIGTPLTSVDDYGVLKPGK